MRGALFAFSVAFVIITAAALYIYGVLPQNGDVHVTASAAMTAAGEQTEVGTASHEKLTSVFGSSLSISEMKKTYSGVINAEAAVTDKAEELARKSPYTVFAAEADPSDNEAGEEYSYDILNDGVNETVKSDADTVEGVLQDAGVEVDTHDVVTPALTARVYPGTMITVEHLNKVTVVADGETFTVYAGRNATVADAVALAGVPVASGDGVSPSEDTAVTDGMTVNVYRIATKYVTKTETVAQKTKVVKTTAIKYGQTRVVSAGKSGTAKVTYKLNYVNGKLTGQEAVKTVYIEEPVDKVVETGKKYKAVYTMEATAYTGSGTTASGLAAGTGRIAVDPSVIPLGTKVYVQGYGEAVAADTGGAIVGNRIDLWFSTEAMCQTFGRRTLKLYVLNY